MNLSDYDFSYLIPPQEVWDVEHSEWYIRHGDIRKIFGNVPYTNYEKEKMKEFEAMIQKEGLQLPPDWTTADTLKFIYSAKFALDKCLENLKLYLIWLNQPSRKIMSPKCLELLKEGLIYFAGWDKQYRPVIIVSFDKIDMKKLTIEEFTEALCALLFVVQKYCFVPGKVENWVIIVETNNASIWNFPFKVLQKMIAVTSVSFTSTLDKLYIMNPSRFLKGSWNIVQKLLHPETSAKIMMVDKHKYTELHEKIPIDQVEERYGGTLKQPQTYWPPRNTLKQPPYRRPDQDPSFNPRTAPLPEIRSAGPRTMESPAKSVYYDFDSVHMESALGKGNRLLKSPLDPVHEEGVLMEKEGPSSRCCEKCNIF